jgi:hypothetical protein
MAVVEAVTVVTAVGFNAESPLSTGSGGPESVVGNETGRKRETPSRKNVM